MKICFLGPQKSGKSSIIKVIFEDVKNHQTKNLESTLNPEIKEFTLANHFEIEITEIPGSIPVNDFVSEKDHLKLKKQDIFIYVINCQNFSPEAELEKLIEIFDITHQKNPESWFYIFYHQVDLQMFLDRSYQQEDYIEKNFKEHLKIKMEGNENKQAEFFRTSLYEYSAHLRMSQLISKYLNRNSDIINRMLEKLQTKCMVRKVYLYDLEKKLYLFNSCEENNIGKLYIYIYYK